MKGYYSEYQPPQPNAALSIAGAAKQVRVGGAGRSARSVVYCQVLMDAQRSRAAFRLLPLAVLPLCSQGFEGLTQRITDYQAEREARAAAVRAEEEEKRLKECSFAPDINRGRVQAKVRRSWGAEACGWRPALLACERILD